MNKANSQSATIWLTGLSASGKSTLGQALKNDLILQGISRVCLLDGEVLRAGLDQKLGHGLEDRFRMLHYIVDRVQKERENGFTTIVSTISHKREMRDYARERLAPFMEVYLSCPTDVCAIRDTKGHYRRAFAGEYEYFVGVTDNYEPSDAPELILETSTMSMELSRERLLRAVLGFLDSERCLSGY